jgi:predicted amidophosphoribosyltransferase
VGNLLSSVECSYCRHSFSLSLERCPHCAQPGLFPNVRTAEQEEERTALNQRYQTAFNNAAHRKADHVLKDFETLLSGLELFKT